jgi:hypothetical protein
MISDGWNTFLDTCDLTAGRARLSTLHCCKSDQSQLVDATLVITLQAGAGILLPLPAFSASETRPMEFVLRVFWTVNLSVSKKCYQKDRLTTEIELG